MTTVFTAVCLYLLISTTADGAYDSVRDFHNYGYLLKQRTEIHVATSTAKVVFHMILPDWQVDFRHNITECTNTSSFRPRHRTCVQWRRVIEAVGDIKARTELYLQSHVRHIYETVTDLPLGDRRSRLRRGFFTDVLSKMSGLATIDDLDAVTEMFEQIQTGILQANRMWQGSSESLMAAFKLDQKRFKNVFNILSQFRQSISEVQAELISMQQVPGWELLAQIFRMLSSTIFQVAEVDSLYNGLQILMSGSIPHTLVSHEAMKQALGIIQGHLNNTTPHRSLCRTDLGYYYERTAFRTFRTDNVLFLIMDVPVTSDAFVHSMNIYELIKIPLPTPQSQHYYTMLATSIKFLGYSESSEFILDLDEDQAIPTTSVWHLTDSTLTVRDGSKKSCSAALINGHLQDIKQYCSYRVHKGWMPRSALRLYGNTFLLTNISTVDMYCLNQNFSDTDKRYTYSLTAVQTVYTFQCYCDHVFADEVRLTINLDVCNNSDRIVSTVNVRFPINLAFLSEFFDMSDFYDLNADSLLNHSVEIRLPDLTIADKKLDQAFGLEKSASFDLQHVINSTKQDITIYENLGHYLFNNMVKSHTKQKDFDLLNAYTWLSIFSWITSGIAIVMVVLMHFKMRSMMLLTMTRGAHALPAAAIPRVIGWTTTAHPTADDLSDVNMLQEWTRHVSHVPNVLPVEILLLLCLVFLLLFKVIRIIYKKRQKETARVKLVMEIGNSLTSVIIPIMNLPHSLQHYRFVINKPDIKFLLIESNFSANLRYKDGIKISNTTLAFPVSLPDTLLVRFWSIKLLRSLLNNPHYASIQVIDGISGQLLEMIVLRTLPSDHNAPFPSQSAKLYPSITY